MTAKRSDKECICAFIGESGVVNCEWSLRESTDESYGMPENLAYADMIVGLRFVATNTGSQSDGEVTPTKTNKNKNA